MNEIELQDFRLLYCILLKISLKPNFRNILLFQRSILTLFKKIYTLHKQKLLALRYL